MYAGPDTEGAEELLRATHNVPTLTAPSPPAGGEQPVRGFEARVVFAPDMDAEEVKDEGDYFRCPCTLHPTPLTQIHKT